MTDKQDFFEGFPLPQQNYCKLPNVLIDALPLFASESELKVVLYLLRHTWGFSEYGRPKHLTLDEFMHGRNKKDGERFDNGTGLSKPSVVKGLRDAEEHGFIVVSTDKNSDGGRVKKLYILNIDSRKGFTPAVKKVYSDGKETLPDFPSNVGAKDTIKKQESVRADESDSLPYHMRNGLGQPRKNHALVLAVKAHSVYQAYVRGRGGIEPDVSPNSAQTLHDACCAVQNDIDAGLYTLEDVEGLTRGKTSEGRPFLLIYIKTDIASYLGTKNKPQGEKPYDSREDRSHIDYLIAHAKS